MMYVMQMSAAELLRHAASECDPIHAMPGALWRDPARCGCAGGSRGRGQSRASSTSRASWGKKRGRVVEDELELEELELEAEQDEDEEDEEMVQLFGCPKCKYTPTGCVGCRDSPLFERPKNLHWQPDKGRPQSVSGTLSAFSTV